MKERGGAGEQKNYGLIAKQPRKGSINTKQQHPLLRIQAKCIEMLSGLKKNCLFQELQNKEHWSDYKTTKKSKYQHQTAAFIIIKSSIKVHRNAARL